MDQPREVRTSERADAAPEVEITVTPSRDADPGVFDVVVTCDGHPGSRTQINTTPREFAFPRG